MVESIIMPPFLAIPLAHFTSPPPPRPGLEKLILCYTRVTMQVTTTSGGGWKVRGLARSTPLRLNTKRDPKQTAVTYTSDTRFLLVPSKSFVPERRPQIPPIRSLWTFTINGRSGASVRDAMDETVVGLDGEKDICIYPTGSKLQWYIQVRHSRPLLPVSQHLKH